MTKTITALTVQKRTTERVNVFLDHDYAFSLSMHAALALKRGQCLSQADIDRLQREDEAHRAYYHALRLLGSRPRSRAEVERHLRRKGYAADAVGAAVERLLDQQYLDDAAFARAWVDNRERFRPRGARALSYELRQKGVDKELIDDVVTGLDEEASAWAAVEGKLRRWRTLDQAAFRNKVMGFLGRRGFGYDTARTVCRRAWQTIAGSDRP